MQQLFPLAIGDTWIVHGQTFDTTGKIITDATYPLLKILGTQQFQGQQAFQALSGISSDTLLFFISGTDLYQVTNFNAQPIIGQYLRYPMNAGETLSLNDSTKLIFQGNNESVTVSAGTFSCYHFDNIVISGKAPFDTLSMDRLYLASGIGIVQDKIYSADSKGIYLSLQLSLSSYTVK